MATVGLMTSCTKDDAVAPTISVSVVGSPTYLPGETVQYKVILGTSNKELSTLEVSGSGSIQPASGSQVNYTEPADKWDAATDKFVSDVTSVTVYYDVVLGSDLSAGTEVELSFEVGDDSEFKGSETAMFTVGGVTGSIKDFTVTLGDQAGSEGSSLNLVTGTQYNSSTSASNAGSIDLIFYKGATNGSTLFAPAQAFSEGISDFLSLGTWGTKANTTFKVVSSSDYDNADYSTLEGLSDGGSHKANNLNGSEYIAFKTDAGVHGIIKVNSVVARKDALGTTNISVKVQDPASSK